MSPYLKAPCRTFEQIAAGYDYEARKIRRQTHETILAFRQETVPTWTRNHILGCLRFARMSHSRAIAQREAYAAAMRERELMEGLCLMGPTP